MGNHNHNFDSTFFTSRDNTRIIIMWNRTWRNLSSRGKAIKKKINKKLGHFSKMEKPSLHRSKISKNFLDYKLWPTKYVNLFKFKLSLKIISDLISRKWWMLISEQVIQNLFQMQIILFHIVSHIVSERQVDKIGAGREVGIKKTFMELLFHSSEGIH